MYSISGYGSMIADRVRTGAYLEALQQVIRPGAVVLEIGTGPGFFALAACRFGARRVYAVEPEDIIQIGREVAAANGYAERIEFIQDNSTRVELPERADVLISDLRGVLPLFRQHLPSIVDARRRLLTPTARLVPLADSIWMAVVEAPGLHEKFTGVWSQDPYGFKLQKALSRVTNSWGRESLKPEQLVTEPCRWATLDYTTLETPHVAGKVHATATRAVRAHGLALWFDSELADGVGLTNAPGKPELVYGSAFFPWCEPVDLAAGDTIDVELKAQLTAEDYLWSWQTTVLSGAHDLRKAHFQQSTFYGTIWSPARLHKRAADSRPALNEDGHMTQLLLALMDGRTPLEEIGRQLRRRYPGRFATPQDAFNAAADLAEKYSR